MNPSDLLQNHLKHHATIPAHSIGVVAVSGGADSMALLHSLMVLQRKHPFSLYAATYDHGLRGKQSAEEAAAVSAVCARWGIPHLTGHGSLDPAAPALESRARVARYAFLAGVARQVGADWVATGHHKDDQAETVLMHLIRGAGLRGVSAMRPLSPMPQAPALTLMRPLLGVSRADLVAYCKHHQLLTFDDPTNDDLTHRRNWARHVALPVLAESNPDISGALARLADAAAMDDSLLDSLVQPAISAAVITSGRIRVPRSVFAALHSALRVRLVFWACVRLGAQEAPTFEQVRAVAALGDKRTGGQAGLSGGLRGRLEHDSLFIERVGVAVADAVPDGFGLTAGASHPLIAGAWYTVPDGRRVRYLSQLGAGVVDFHAAAGQKVLLRTPLSGERVKPASLGGHSKRMKDWLIDQKIPQRWRSRLPVLAVDDSPVALWDGTRWHRFWSEENPNHSLAVK